MWIAGCVLLNCPTTCCRRASSSGPDDQPDSVTVVALAVLVPAWAAAARIATAAIRPMNGRYLRIRVVLLLVAPVPCPERGAAYVPFLLKSRRSPPGLTPASRTAMVVSVEAVSKRQPSIADVAARAGVGESTVSRVLNARSNVRPATRERVLAAIRDLDYRPSATARNLSLGRTMVIAVVVPFFTNPSAVERVRGIVSVLGRSRYDMTLFDLEAEERQHRAFELLDRSDGLLIVSTRPADADVRRLGGRHVPCVL